MSIELHTEGAVSAQECQSFAQGPMWLSLTSELVFSCFRMRQLVSVVRHLFPKHRLVLATNNTPAFVRLGDNFMCNPSRR